MALADSQDAARDRPEIVDPDLARPGAHNLAASDTPGDSDAAGSDAVSRRHYRPLPSALPG